MSVFDVEGHPIDTWVDEPGRFVAPTGIAFDSNGFVYVSDDGRNDVQRFTSQGELVGSIQGHEPEWDNFYWVPDVAVGKSGLIYVPDSGWPYGRLLEFWYQGTMVRASVPSMELFVDGERFVGSELFPWPEESVHEITTTASQFPEPGVRYDFQDWNGNSGISQSIIATNPPGSHLAKFRRSFRLDYEIIGDGSIEPASGWYLEGTPIPVIPHAGPNSGFCEWAGNGIGSYTGRNLIPIIQMHGPITETGIFRRYGFDFTISASDTDPFAISAEPANEARNLYLWLTCADRGLSAFEADVSGSLEPLAFIPADGV
jgi:hypothetical protein